MPVIRHLEMQWAVGLYHAMTGSLRDCIEHMVLDVTWLDRLTVGANKRHVLTLLVFETDLPPVKKLRPGMNVSQLLVLERPLEFAADYIFQAIVGDHMVMCALILHGYGLLHQAPLFELVAVNQGATESTLLVWG